MDTIIIKIIESLGVPGILVAILYIIWQQKVISIVKASDIERQFFTHEKRFVYRLYNRIGMFLWTFILFFFISVWLVNKSKFFNIPSINIFVNILVSMIAVASFIIYFFKSKEWVLRIKKTLSKNDKLRDSIIAFFYVVLMCYSIYSIIAFIDTNKLFKNYDIAIFVNSLFVSLIAPETVIILIRTWLNFDETYFYYSEENSNWYLLKPHDNEVLVGDKPIEGECIRFRFIVSSELKKKTILKETVLIMKS